MPSATPRVERLPPAAAAGRARVLLLGPSRAAVSGVATHLNVLFDSPLAGRFELTQFQVGSEGRAESRARRALRLAASPLRLLWRVLRERPAVVHFNTSLDHSAFWRDALYLLTLRPTGARLLWQVHGGHIARFLVENRPLRWAIKRVLRLPDALVVLCAAEARYYRERLGLERVVEVANAIDLGPYRQRSAHRRPGPWRLLYVGRLAADKGVVDLVDAAALLRRRNPRLRFELLLAGSGPCEEELHTRVVVLGIEGYVRFLGPVFGADKVSLWMEADLFLFPTYHAEGLSYALLESIAAGTPVVTTRMGGNAEVVRPGVEGVFVEPRNPHQLAEVVRGLLADPQRLAAMSGACRQRAQERYHCGRLAGEMEAVYRELMVKSGVKWKVERG